MISDIFVNKITNLTSVQHIPNVT